MYAALGLLACVAQSIGYMLSAMFEQEMNAMALAPLFVMPMVLFGGLMANNKAQFDWLSWIQYISPMKYCAEAILYNEFMYDKYNVRETLTDTIDYNLGLGPCLLVLIALFFAFRTLAFLFFWRLSTKA